MGTNLIDSVDKVILLYLDLKTTLEYYHFSNDYFNLKAFQLEDTDEDLDNSRIDLLKGKKS